jgi:endonuclease YncB( thermonuclease family)
MKTALLTTLLIVLCNSVFAESYTARVVSIADGDTVTVLDAENRQHKIRLVGIDAPEKHQPYGNVSRKHLGKLVHQRTVTIETNKLDKYKRELGKIILDGKDINLEQVRAGYAWHYKNYMGDQSTVDRESYAQAEDEARINQLGLWRDENPEPPWDFRHQSRATSSTTSPHVR